jgi:hypothetical protein
MGNCQFSYRLEQSFPNNKYINKYVFRLHLASATHNFPFSFFSTDENTGKFTKPAVCTYMWVNDNPADGAGKKCNV